MMLPNGDDTFTVGLWDVLCILTGPDDRYYAAFLEERPFPGSLDARPNVVRLFSKMTHTAGADDFATAQGHLDELCKTLKAHDDNVWRDSPMDWDGTKGACFLLPPWREA